MSYETVKRIDYDDELWILREPHPALADFLTAKDRLIVLRSGEPPFQVVLGVPHQATIGEEYICKDGGDENKRRDSDENAASYALVAFTVLRDRGIPCKLVIMAHATTHDPNKKPKSPYCEEIFADESSLLFECHGAGPSRRLSLELSAGSNTLADTRRFGEALASALGGRFTLGVQKEAGEKQAWLFLTDDTEKKEGELELAAIDTESLKAAERKKIPALHLEAKPSFRKPADGSNTVPPDGLVLGRAIAQAIIQYLNR